MTRKDYIAIAETLRDLPQTVRILPEQIAYAISEAFERDNPRFDREHFLAVVRGDRKLQSRPLRREVQL